MKNLIVRIVELVRSLFFNGLLIVLPITLTFLLFKASFKLIKGWLSPLQDYLPLAIRAIPHSEFFVILGSVLLIGVIVKFLVLKPIIHLIEEHFVMRIPLVRPVYSGIKQLVSAFTSQDKLSFNTVVLLEFPSAGIHSIGFLTGQFPPAVSPNNDKKYFNIYVPTTPNPTTGFFVLLPEGKFSVIDLSRQEAMSLIISGGIIKPERFMQN
jgi:uncharacterized membrane protein